MKRMTADFDITLLLVLARRHRLAAMLGSWYRRRDRQSATATNIGISR